MNIQYILKTFVKCDLKFDNCVVIRRQIFNTQINVVPSIFFTVFIICFIIFFSVVFLGSVQTSVPDVSGVF